MSGPVHGGLDVSIVNVALPAIGDDLGFSATGLQWVLNAGEEAGAEPGLLTRRG